MKKETSPQFKHPLLQIWKAEDDFWHWHHTAENGNIISKSSEGYSSLQACLDGYNSAARLHLSALQFSEDEIINELELLHDVLQSSLCEVSRERYVFQL